MYSFFHVQRRKISNITGGEGEQNPLLLATSHVSTLTIRITQFIVSGYQAQGNGHCYLLTI